MMKILSINKVLEHDGLFISNIQESALLTQPHMYTFDYIVIHGGDGSIRRVIKILHRLQYKASIILNPIGSFNVIAKLHRVPKLHKVLNVLTQNENLKTSSRIYYSLNDEIFLFSAGNMGDLQHILLSETFRFGILKNGVAKYVLSILFLLPVHLIMTPFMLMSKNRFFIFTSASFIRKFGSFYGSINKIQIDLDNHYNHIELDGDIVTIEEKSISIQKAGEIFIVSG